MKLRGVIRPSEDRNGSYFYVDLNIELEDDEKEILKQFRVVTKGRET